jgi:hypothetical protein
MMTRGLEMNAFYLMEGDRELKREVVILFPLFF